MPRCSCVLCKGAIRDSRAIRKHLSSPYFKKQDVQESISTSVSVSFNQGPLDTDELLDDAKTPDDYVKQPCFCPQCCGRIRDRHTVKAHFNSFGPGASSSSTFDRSFTASLKISVPCSGESECNIEGNSEDNIEHAAG